MSKVKCLCKRQNLIQKTDNFNQFLNTNNNIVNIQENNINENNILENNNIIFSNDNNKKEINTNEELLSKEKCSKDKIENNFIIAKFKIEKNNLEQRIINSYEYIRREDADVFDWEEIQGTENEDQIKDCDIYINNEKIENNYNYNFH